MKVYAPARRCQAVTFESSSGAGNVAPSQSPKWTTAGAATPMSAMTGAAGASDFLVRPVAPERLIEILTRHGAQVYPGSPAIVRDALWKNRLLEIVVPTDPLVRSMPADDVVALK